MELENRPHCPKGIPGWPVNNWDNVVVKVFIPTDVWSVLYSSYWEYSFIVSTVQGLLQQMLVLLYYT